MTTYEPPGSFTAEAEMDALLDRFVDLDLKSLDVPAEVLSVLENFRKRILRADSLAWKGGVVVAVFAAAVAAQINPEEALPDLIAALIGAGFVGMTTFIARHFDRITFTGPRVKRVLRESGIEI